MRSSIFHLSRAKSSSFFTTPIFYVNADPHIGHLYSIVVADTLARYSKLKNPASAVYFSTGTDEHGLKVQQSANARGLSPLSLCDDISTRFRQLATAANSSHTDFIRTTDSAHISTVHSLWNTLYENGYIYKGSHEGWYAVSDEAFYPDNAVSDYHDAATGQSYKVSTETGKRVEWMSEVNYKFRLSQFRQRLIDWLLLDPHVIHPSQQYNSILSSLQSNQAANSDLSISRPRSRLNWGIPVPNDPDHTIYVWVDALTNYYSVAQSHGEDVWPADVHVVGKDIIRFHAIYWPALLLAANLPLPKTILSHAHWTMNSSKMSKSTGNVVDPFKAIHKYSSDALRFYLLRVGGNFSNDADFKPLELELKYKSTLQGMLGNLLSRISGKKILRKVTSTPFIADRLDEKGEPLRSKLDSLRLRYTTSMDAFEIGKALEAIEDALHEANRYFAKVEPWSDQTSTDDTIQSVIHARESLRIIGILLQPVMPAKSKELLDRLGVDASTRSLADASLNLTLTQSLTPNALSGVLFPPLSE
ncbi:hypothetical protein E3P99_04107 [Wallemia hederae]|uniref:Probable methionine--tRNA ligase, mitochondrial n=1 Tax=Wallemia hederae TaxID=1540922 RepID=A0A4T0FD32_9BASI|nr:hypothetical protein E3P99_04107 [Wallemia hederae]